MRQSEQDDHERRDECSEENEELVWDEIDKRKRNKPKGEKKSVDFCPFLDVT